MVNLLIHSIAVLDHAEVEFKLFLTDRLATNNYLQLNTSLLNYYEFEAFILEELKFFMDLNQSTGHEQD